MDLKPYTPDSVKVANKAVGFAGRMLFTKLGALAFLAFLVYAVFERISRENAITGATMFAWIVGIGAVVVLIVAFIMSSGERQLQRNIDAAAPYGPFDVGIKMRRDHPLTHMQIDMKVTKEDWYTIERMGIRSEVMFHVPPLNEKNRLNFREQFGTDYFPVNLNTLVTEGVFEYPFKTALQANAAKEMLIESLARLRMQIEAFREAADTGHSDRVEI